MAHAHRRSEPAHISSASDDKVGGSRRDPQRAAVSKLILRGVAEQHVVGAVEPASIKQRQLNRSLEDRRPIS